MCVVVEHEGELYSLSSMRSAMSLRPDEAPFDGNPSTLDRVWRDVSAGIYRLADRLLVTLDLARTLDVRSAPAAA